MARDWWDPSQITGRAHQVHRKRTLNGLKLPRSAIRHLADVAGEVLQCRPFRSFGSLSGWVSNAHVTCLSAAYRAERQLSGPPRFFICTVQDTSLILRQDCLLQFLKDMEP